MSSGDLVLENVVKTYGEFTAVGGVSFAVHPGEFVTLLGPSGSGKTTTLMMIAGFIYPTSGAVHYRGRDMTFMPPHLRNIGMVFQNYALFPHMTVAENVGFPLRMRKVPAAESRERVRAALDLVHMSGHEERVPSQLSGGQQQRIALARALVFQPSLLLMDEPLGALDRYLREHLQSEIKQVQRKTGVSIVYVTHDQQEALVMSDRVIVMNRGAVHMDAPPADIYERPADAFVAQFVGETNWLSGVAAQLPGGRSALQLAPDIVVPVPDHSAGARNGTTLRACLRPERIRLNDDMADVVLDAHVADVTYLGDSLRFRVALARAPQISITGRVLAGAQNEKLAHAAKIQIGWNTDDLWIPPRGGDE